MTASAPPVALGPRQLVLLFGLVARNLPFQMGIKVSCTVFNSVALTTLTLACCVQS